jgi:hypothetical protein
VNAPVHLLSNQPTDPFEAFSLHIDDLFDQAQQFLDGKPIENEQQAEAVSRILNMVRKAGNDADDARKAEKKPHDDAAKAVQSKWKPILDKVDLAASVAKRALAPWLTAKEAEQQAAAQAAAQEARDKAEAAAKAAEQVRPDDLAGQTTVRVLRENAADLARKATRLDKKPVQARGGERAVSLRSVWETALVDPVAALKHYRERQPEELKAWLLSQAERDVRAGARTIPGFTVTEARVAV